MKGPKVTLARLEKIYGQQGLISFVEDEAEIKAALIEIETKKVCAPLRDDEVPRQFQHLVPKWRALVGALGWKGVVVNQVKAGFDFRDAPKLGPCYQDWGYTKDWKLQDEELTKSCLVFGPPRILPSSTGKNVQEQLELMAQWRRRFDLPEHHLAGFGSVHLLSAFNQSHHKRTGERTPKDSLWIRTDTLRVDGYRLRVGGFGADGLDCGGLAWDDYGGGLLGCFPLGVEVLGA